MRFFDLLLRVYPRGFRDRFGRDMRAAFAEDLVTARRRGGFALAWFVVVTAIAAVWYGALEHLPKRSFMRSLVSVELRDAVRSLRATPIVTVVAVISLALGVGANTALFSIVNGLFLKPLPVRAPHELVMVGDGSWTNPAWEALARVTPPTFVSMGAWSYDRFDLAERGASDLVDGSYVSGRFFEMLGAGAAIGRVITPADDRRGVPDGLVAVISDRLWRSRFGGSPAAIGQRIIVNRASAVVVGVMPRGFFGADVGRVVDVYLPIAGEGVVAGQFSALDRRQNFWLAVGGRLAPGATLPAGAAALEAVAPEVREAAMPDERVGKDRETFMDTAFETSSLERGRSIFRAEMRQPLAILMAVVGGVLLIACANIANVLLARASARRHEMSVRLALGASRWRLARQMLVESLLVASTGAAIGLLVARSAGLLLVQQFTFRNLSVTLDLDPDWRVFAFTALVAFITTLVFGLAPAAGVSSLSPHAALKEQSRSVAGDGRNVVRHTLLVAQVAISVALVVGAGLLVRTFAGLANAPLGFDPSRLLVVNANIGRAGVPVGQRLIEYERLRDAVASVPGVRAVAISFATPLSGRSILTGVERPGMAAAPDDQRFMQLALNQVSPEFFDAYRSRLLAGRLLTRADRAGTEPVAVINETLAKQLFGSPNAVGKELKGSLGLEEATHFAVVGVVADTLYRSARRGVEPLAYVTMSQIGYAGATAQFTVDVAGDLDTVRRAVGETLGRTSPAASFNARPFDAQVRSTFSQERLLAILAGAFGLLAVFLASVGLYGVTAYSVSRRRGEIAVRIALGSSAERVVRLVLGKTTKLVAIGAAVGLGISIWATRYLASLLFGVPPNDAVTMAGAVAVMGLIGVLAAWLPARRASRLDPLSVLRE